MNELATGTLFGVEEIDNGTLHGVEEIDNGTLHASYVVVDGLPGRGSARTLRSGLDSGSLLKEQRYAV
jgi:hypothetical protein